MLETIDKCLFELVECSNVRWVAGVLNDYLDNFTQLEDAGLAYEDFGWYDSLYCADKRFSYLVLAWLHLKNRKVFPYFTQVYRGSFLKKVISRVKRRKEFARMNRISKRLQELEDIGIWGYRATEIIWREFDV